MHNTSDKYSTTLPPFCIALYISWQSASDYVLLIMFILLFGLFFNMFMLGLCRSSTACFRWHWNIFMPKSSPRFMFISHLSTSGRSFRQTVLIQILLLFHSPNEMKFMKKLGSCLFQDAIGRRHRLGIINNKQNSFAELWTKYTGNTQFHHVNSCWRQNSEIRAFHERNIHLFILEIQIFRLLSLCK